MCLCVLLLKSQWSCCKSVISVGIDTVSVCVCVVPVSLVQCRWRCKSVCFSFFSFLSFYRSLEKIAIHNRGNRKLRQKGLATAIGGHYQSWLVIVDVCVMVKVVTYLLPIANDSFQSNSHFLAILFTHRYVWQLFSLFLSI